MDKTHIPMVHTRTKTNARGRFALRCGLFATLGVLTLSLLGGVSAGKTPVAVAADGVEEEVGIDRISFSLTSSASTGTSHSFNCVVSSTMIESISNSSRFKSVYVVIDDENFNYGKISDASTAIQEEQEQAKEAGEEWTAPHFSAYVYRIFNDSTSKNVVIPRTLFFAETFYVDITSIGSDVCRTLNGKERTYADIESIWIPDTVTSISRDAFVGAKEAGVVFNIQAENDDDFEPEWTDADAGNIHFGADFTSSAIERIPLDQNAAGLLTDFGEGEDFLVGYHEGENPLPLRISYDLVPNDGASEKISRVDDLPLHSVNGNYDSVGTGAGAITIDFPIDIEVEPGYLVDPESVVFHNIYKCKRAPVDPADASKGTTLVPDPDYPAYFAKPRLRFSTTVLFMDLFAFEAEQSGITSFGGYTRIGIKVKRNVGAYELMAPASYNRNHKDIDSGAVYVRHQFSSLEQSYFRVTYLEGNTPVVKNVNVVTPIKNFVVAENNETELGFLILDSEVGPGFSSDKIKQVEFCHFTVKLDLIRVDKGSKVIKSEASAVFSALPLLAETKNNAPANLNVVTVIVFVAYVILFSGIAVGYYFYAKNKYKNDEFRRMNTKKYIKEAVKNGLGIALIVAAIYFIICRWGFFDGNIVTYNPFDILVILFAIAGAIFAGFAIKGIVSSVKDMRKRKEAIRLHLDQDKAEDGTK